jgi:hypothetical protein
MKINEVMGDEKDLCLDVFTGTSEEKLVNSLSFRKKRYMMSEKLKYDLF